MTLSSLLDPQPLLVSFDIFDTLLLRRVERPVDLFEQMGERARAAGLVDPALAPPLFRLARQEAERRARAAVRGGEVMLPAIHAELGLGDPAALMALELALEAEQILANPLLVPLLRDLAAAGVPVVLLSDMYLPPTDLAALLAGVGIEPDLYRRLYVSGAVGCSKRDGGLFRVLAADHPAIPPGRMLHVGDDPVGDVTMARAAGLQAIHYVPGPGLARLRERERALSGLGPAGPDSPARRLAALAGREDPEADTFALEFGALVLGPAVGEYCRWVVEECHRQGLRRIAPLMREAALFAPLMRDWIAHRGYDMVVTPLFVSRQALMPLELERLDAGMARRLLTDRPHLTWDGLLALIGGAVPPELRPLTGLTLERLLALPIGEGENTADRVLALFDDPTVQKQALAQAVERRGMLLDYLSDRLGNEEPVALVDLGARGSTPAALVRLMPEGSKRHRIFLAYAVADIAAALADGLNVQVFADLDQTGLTLGRILYRSPQILERVLTGLEGTTLGYRREGDGTVVPIQADPPAVGAEARCLSLIRQGIRRYAALMIPARAPVAGNSALLPLAAALLRPTVREAAILGDLAYDQNDGTVGERVICDETALIAVRPLAEMGEGPLLSLALGVRPSLAPWPQGALTRLDPGLFQRPADRLVLDGGHGPVSRALIERLRAQGVRRFGVVAVGGEGGMGPDFIRLAREAGLEPTAYADLMAHLLSGPHFHGLPVREVADMPSLGLPLALVTLGYAEQLMSLLRAQATDPDALRLIAVTRSSPERRPQ